LLQAETEDDLMSWLKVFEAAKVFAMKFGQQSPMGTDEDASDVKTAVDAKPLGGDDDEWDAIAPTALTRKREFSPERQKAGGAAEYASSQSHLYQI
jgi:hypothetical protein